MSKFPGVYPYFCESLFICPMVVYITVKRVTNAKKNKPTFSPIKYWLRNCTFSTTKLWISELQGHGTSNGANGQDVLKEIMLCNGERPGASKWFTFIDIWWKWFDGTFNLCLLQINTGPCFIFVCLISVIIILLKTLIFCLCKSLYFILPSVFCRIWCSSTVELAEAEIGEYLALLSLSYL